MVSKIEQCVCISFCLKLGKSATDATETFHETLEHSSSRAADFQ
jgi:hypothetical protein